MRLVVFCVVASLSMIFCHSAYSLEEVVDQKYFDFELSTSLLRDGQEVSVTFKYDIKDLDMKSQKRLTVKPYISAGAVEIYNGTFTRFIGVADLNSTFPYMRDEMRLKFSGVQSSENSMLLEFVIYDTLTGKSYATSRKKVWGTAYYKKYAELLNENILKIPSDKGVLTEAVVGENATSDDKPRDPVKLYLWYLAPAFFLYGLLKSPNGYG